MKMKEKVWGYVIFMTLTVICMVFPPNHHHYTNLTAFVSLPFILIILSLHRAHNCSHQCTLSLTYISIHIFIHLHLLIDLRSSMRTFE